MKRIFFVLSLVAVAALVYSCSRQGAGPVDEKDVVARVGDKVITAAQIDQFLENIPPQMAGKVNTDKIRREIAEGFVKAEIMAIEARRRGLDKREDVKLKIDMLASQALARELEKELRKEMKLSEEELRKYYDENKDRFSAKRRMRASRITVPTEAAAKDVIARINKGEDFAELAKKFSKDVYAQRGGSMGTIRPGKLEPEIENVLSSLQEGKVSKAVKTGQGYVIVRLDSVVDIPERSFEEAKPRIERILVRERLEKALKEIDAEVRKKNRVVINEGYFVKYGKPAPAAPQAAPGPEKAPGADAEE